MNQAREYKRLYDAASIARNDADIAFYNGSISSIKDVLKAIVGAEKDALEKLEEEIGDL